jgi:hypothetical protein
MWNLDSLLVDGTLVVTIAGDFTGDGVVDAADYSVYRDKLGTASTPFTGADATGDGLVTAADLAAWNANYGMSVTINPPAASAAIPEPVSMLLSAGLALSSLLRRPTALTKQP